ncbi:MAG: hypothetical protein WBD51_21710, partial [Burkholderiaceae bacterium]
NLLEAQKKAAERIKRLQMKEQERICKIMDKLSFLEMHHTDEELAAMFKDQLAKKGNGHDRPSATHLNSSTG